MLKFDTVAGVVFVLICVILGFTFRDHLPLFVATPSKSPQRLQATPPSFAQVYRKLKIAPLAAEVAASQAIADPLKALDRSICDKVAINRLTTELGIRGNLRAAAKALLGFADICPNSLGERWTAANMLYSAGDYADIIPVLDKLIAERPDVGVYYVMRGEMLIHLGRPQEAIENLSTAIAFFENIEHANERVYQLLASAYAADGQLCQAMTAVQTYVYIDPQTRETASTKMLIADYAKKGKCDVGYADGSAVIPRRSTDVTYSRVSINGVVGTFLVDTGASFVSVDEKFAKRAKISLHKARKIRLHTANGVADATLTSAALVEMGKVRAENVSVAIVPKSLGQGVDGLLGMSFLARFDVALTEREVRINARKTSGLAPNSPSQP